MTSSDAIQQVISTASTTAMSELFDRAARGHDGLVIAGASGLVCEHTLMGLSRLEVSPIALVDNNPAMWGSAWRDVPIVAPETAVARYPDAAYVAAVFTHTPLRRQLSQLGAARVIPYATLFHKFPEVFLPFFAVDNPSAIAAQANEVQRAAHIWADEESYRLYVSILNWFVTLDSEQVPRPLPAHDTYFPDVLRFRPDEVFVDCGAFDGDTALAYAAACGGQYDSILALEPDPYTFSRLRTRVATLRGTVPMNVAVGDRPGSIPFLANGALSSHARSAGADGLSPAGQLVDVDVVRLDDLDPRPTYVKMDIEGFESEALAGARGLLSGASTAFAVTLYHRMSDLWKLPLYIHDCAPGLKLFLRHYAEDWAEAICYAIPPDRVRQNREV